MKHIFLVLEYGHVTRARDESGRPGRPRQLFTLTAPAEPSGTEQRNYLWGFQNPSCGL